MRQQNWNDDYWLLVMQLYLRKPVGVKPMYSRAVVDLALELHIHPSVIVARMNEIANVETPRIERIRQTYSKSPQRLARAVRLLREMKGYGNADEFYEGVEVEETFERDFRPVAEDTTVTPVMLTMVLDLYFRLTPLTMVAETPEVQDLARLMRLKAEQVVAILDIFQHCDPYLNREDVLFSPLYLPCQQVWQRFATMETEQLAAYAEQLRQYFLS